MRVLKFGGKSLENKEKMQKICKFIKKTYKKDKQLIIIVSAMGNETNHLLSLSQDFCKNKISKLDLASLLSTGETKSAALFSGMLCSLGLPSQSFGARNLQIESFGDPTNSLIKSINKSKLENCLNKNIICVVAGFQAVDNDDFTTTLGRGGSDTTAAAISSLFNVPCEIYSDFSGVFAGDPREMKYKKIKNISYDSMIKMANGGAKVLDKNAVKIAEKYKFPIISKGSTNPTKTGTNISGIEDNFISLSTLDNFCKITIIFSKNNSIFAINSTIKIIQNFKFLDLQINDDSISFFVEKKNKQEIIKSLAKKLNLLKNE